MMTAADIRKLLLLYLGRASLGVLVAVALLEFCPLNVRADNADLHAIQTRLRTTVTYLRAISNVEWKVEERVEAPPDKDYPQGIINVKEYRFFASGLKYRTEYKSTFATGEVIKAFDMVYDGKTLTTSRPDVHYVTQAFNDTLSDPVSPNNPLTAHLMFLGNDSDLCPACRLRFKDVFSDDLFDHVIFANAYNSNGVLHFEMAGLPLYGHATTWYIVMNAEGEQFTPSSIERVIPGMGTRVCVFNAYTNLAVGGGETQEHGTLYFPSSFSYKDCRDDGSLVSSVETRLKSIDLPKSIAASVFQIDTTHANVIWNGETKSVTKGAAVLAALAAKHSRIRYFWLCILALGTIAFAISLKCAKKQISSS
jgi:hypothetical protein